MLASLSRSLSIMSSIHMLLLVAATSILIAFAGNLNLIVLGAACLLIWWYSAFVYAAVPSAAMPCLAKLFDPFFPSSSPVP